jgi:hypothetical protein
MEKKKVAIAFGHFKFSQIWRRRRWQLHLAILSSAKYGDGIFDVLY